ncbi:MAG: hypothetical protein AB1529_03035 [Candidatus Micrarchaeota archaeon]
MKHGAILCATVGYFSDDITAECFKLMTRQLAKAAEEVEEDDAAEDEDVCPVCGCEPCDCEDEDG